ncbi:MAG: hypothetical protein EOO13_02140 [Chitinophagaceae bacterium]|nr:MAG: hypothetical protein EOO13_02140 [Chitinophagaceae bacterium]
MLVVLMLALFIYLFYRTDKTVVNGLFSNLFSLRNYLAWKQSIRDNLPLSNWMIYSLPEALWVFAVSLASKFLFIKVGRWRLDLFYCPLLFSIGLELLQLFGLTPGRFDALDIILSLLAWLVARYLLHNKGIYSNIFQPITTRSVICIISYALVYLAHVWK